MPRIKNLALIGLLAILGTAGCTKTEIRDRYIQPECSAPPQPNLPTVDAGELWDRIGSADFYSLQDRERLLVDWALEMQSMINVLCR